MCAGRSLWMQLVRQDCFQIWILQIWTITSIDTQDRRAYISRQFRYVAFRCDRSDFIWGIHQNFIWGLIRLMLNTCVRSKTQLEVLSLIFSRTGIESCSQSKAALSHVDNTLYHWSIHCKTTVASPSAFFSTQGKDCRWTLTRAGYIRKLIRQGVLCVHWKEIHQDQQVSMDNFFLACDRITDLVNVNVWFPVHNCINNRLPNVSNFF